MQLIHLEKCRPGVHLNAEPLKCTHCTTFWKTKRAQLCCTPSHERMLWLLTFSICIEDNGSLTQMYNVIFFRIVFHPL